MVESNSGLNKVRTIALEFEAHLLQSATFGHVGWRRVALRWPQIFQLPFSGPSETVAVDQVQASLVPICRTQLSFDLPMGFTSEEPPSAAWHARVRS